MSRSRPLYEARDNAEGKVDVVRVDDAGNVLELCEVCDDMEAAQDAIEGYEEGFYAEQEARAAGDDPRYEPPDDPHAYQNELAEQWRDFVRGETEE